MNKTLARLLQNLPTDSIPKGKIYKSFARIVRGSQLTWDPWLLKDGNLYRLFYLASSTESSPWWADGKICSAVSRDLKNWQQLGVILEPEPSNPWESGRMCAGFACKEDNVYYLFYSAAGEGKDLKNESIGLATSLDGVSWERYSTEPLLKPKEDDPWYGWCNNHFQWRDPYIVKDGQSGKYYMFICASLKETGVDNKYKGCVGLAVADKITGPYKLLPPAAIPLVEGTKESIHKEMERPQVIYKNGKYHLFFSCWTYTVNPKWLQQLDSVKITNSSLYHYVAESITGPFLPISKEPLVVGSHTTGLYGTNFIDLDQPEKLMAYGWYKKMSKLEVSPQFRASFNNQNIEIF